MDGQRHVRALVRLVCVALLAMAVVSIGAAPASAHADFVSASPDPGSGLPQAPGAVVMKFSEPVIRDLSSIQVVGPAGETATEGPTLAVEGDPSAMKRRLGLLAPGQYTVRWTTVSPLDGHTLRGTYTFGIGTASLPNEAVQAGPVDSEGVAGIIGRFVAVTGLAVWAGALIAGRAAMAAGFPAHRLQRLRIAAAVSSAAGTSVSLASSAWVSTGTLQGLPQLLSSQSGLLRGLIVVAAMFGALADWRRPTWRWLVGFAAAVALGVEAASGHAASSAQPWLAIPSFAIHLGAVGVWLFAIVAALFNPAGTVSTLKALSSYAVRAAVVVLATGLLSSIVVLGGLHDLIDTAYGRVLGLKVVGFVAMVALGWLHHRRRTRGHVERRVHGILRSELATGGMALALATVLIAFPNPPRESATAALAAEGDPLLTSLAYREAVSVGGTAGPYVLGLTILPPEPGAVQVRLQVLGIEPGDGLRDARLTAAGPAGADLDITLEACGQGCFAGDGTLAADGAWTFTAAVTSNRGPVRFTTQLPLPVPDGSDELERALDAMAQLQTARVDEILREQETGGPRIDSRYLFKQPDRLKWAVENGTTRIGIDTRGYVTDANGENWRAYDWSAGGFRWPSQYYRDFFAGRAAVSLVGSGEVDGRPVDFVTFVQPTYPAWYRVAIDRETGRILRLGMRAERHVMDQTLGDFNDPVTIRPPEVSG